MAAAQQAVLDAIEGVQGRGKGGMTPEQQARFEEAVAILEADGGIKVGGVCAAACCILHAAGASACRWLQALCFGRAASFLLSSLRSRTCCEPGCCKHRANHANHANHALCVRLQAPTASPQLDGRWRLLFTTRPGTASPIQRTFTAVDKFSGAWVPPEQVLACLLLPSLLAGRA